MAKTCRGCKFVSIRWWCHYHQWLTTKPCDDHKPRETPLLVDALTKACQVAFTHLSGEATKFSEREPIAVRSRLKKALTRYKEEVSDAQAL